MAACAMPVADPYFSKRNNRVQIARFALFCLGVFLAISAEGEGSSESISKFLVSASTLFGDARESFHTIPFGVSPDSRALVFGITDGFDEQLSKFAQQNMRKAGLAHLTAVSGMNCVIVIALVKYMVAGLLVGRRMQVLIIMGAVVSYLMLVGPQPSILRASFMALLVTLSGFFGRNPGRLTPIALAVFVLLVFEPQLAFDLGFLLSVLATFGLLVLAPALAEKLENRMPKPLAGALAVALSAQVATLPVIIYLQAEINLGSVLANMLVEPLIYPVTILGLAAFLLSNLSPVLAIPPLSIASYISELLLHVAVTFGQRFPSISVDRSALAIGIAALIAFSFSAWAIIRTKNQFRTLSVIFLIILSFTLSSLAGRQIADLKPFARDWKLVGCDVGQGDATLLRLDSQVMLIDTGNDFGKLKSCLAKANVSRIDHLVLTHFDQDHVGALPMLLEELKIGVVYTNDFQDSRWAATKLRKRILSENIPIQIVRRGFEFDSAGFELRVLAPAQDYGEDSNDASIVLHVNYDDFHFLALADTGERAQMALFESGNLVASLSGKPLVVKVAHHGSSDQFFELYEMLKPEIALISVGANNSYGHPTVRTIRNLALVGSKVIRTDEIGSISISSSSF